MRLSTPVTDRDHILGSSDAPATLLVYGDYACPRCQQVDLVTQAICKELGNSLRYVFRHFPLRAIHPLAQYAAEVAEAAGVQGCFWPMHNYLFHHSYSLGDELVLQFATELGMEVSRFEQEVAEHLYAAKVQADLDSGITSGVNGTPTFFINSSRYNGRLAFEPLLTELKTAVHHQETL